MVLSDLFAEGKQPNVLFIITDQERSLAQWPASYQPTLAAKMPAMQQLTGNGLSFANAFTGACMCSPSRATFLTSQYPQMTGCLSTGGPPLPPPSAFPNLATVLSAAGYDCYWIGKWHLLGGEEPGSSSGDLAPWGFQTWDPNDAGITLGTTYLGGGTIDGAPGTPNQNDQRYLSDALAFLADPPASPYCLVVSLVNPHDVHLGYMNQAANYYDANDYTATGAPLPANVDEDLSSKPRAQSSYTFVQMSDGNGASEQDFVDFYAYLVEYVDSQIKQILDAMSTDALNQTLIVRFADHGELGLSHGLVEKFVNAYDEAIHVPLVFSNPLVWPQGAATQALASSVDLLPTLANLLGVSAQFSGLAGADLSSVLDGGSDSVQDYVHYTYDDMSQGGPSVIRAVRSSQWLYAVYVPTEGSQGQGGDWEMYDLSADPQQDTNLAGNPAYAEQQWVLEAELAIQMKEKNTIPAGWPPQYVAGQSRGRPAQG
ncbi:sulfatase-like hydrolase/transferase [Lysobacter sp. CA199]|uniref:sulfatase-like hydrolase/transferase n=1 Tax=Lysobacter sp. CA199 TaxID=3455608 RepID=UPI003F8D5C16